jgi:polyadenylate-binding protein
MRRGKGSPGYSQPSMRSRSRSPQRGGERSRSFTQIYVNGISRYCTKEDIDKAFGEWGTIRSVVIKQRYAFIDYKHPEDAAEAVKQMNGRMLRDYKLVVEQSSKYSVSSLFPVKKCLNATIV